jgi:hypothetical protein
MADFSPKIVPLGSLAEAAAASAALTQEEQSLNAIYEPDITMGYMEP